MELRICGSAKEKEHVPPVCHTKTQIQGFDVGFVRLCLSSRHSSAVILRAVVVCVRGQTSRLASEDQTERNVEVVEVLQEYR